MNKMYSSEYSHIVIIKMIKVKITYKVIKSCYNYKHKEENNPPIDVLLKLSE